MTVTQIHDLISYFQERGMFVENRNSHRITMLDETGDQVPVTIDSLMTKLASTQDASFQFWLDDTSTDVYCRFRYPSPSTLVQTYGLNGLNPDERLRVQHVLWDAFGRDLSLSDGLIADRYIQEWVDWDDAVVKGAIPTHYLPDLIALRQRAPRSIGDGGRHDEFLVVVNSRRYASER